MADLISIEQVKAQLNIVDDDSDTILQVYMLGAVQYGLKETGGRVLDDMTDNEVVLFRVAVLQMIAHWYANREPVVVGASVKADQVPGSADKIFDLLTSVSIG